MKKWSGALLVAGTAIGAGMLALPVVTSLAGFLPSTIFFFICWLFMAATGLLMFEICLWLPKDSNLVSMSSHLIGKTGKIVSWSLYIFLFYCLEIAYVSGGGGFVNSLFSGSLGPTLSTALFVVVFAPFVFWGAKAVDRINLVLMIGLIASYFAFLLIGMDEVKLDVFHKGDWSQGLLALPVIFTSFSYQGIVPSLSSYLDKNPGKMRFAIIAGTAVPLIIYILWEWFILGIVPVNGEFGLLAARNSGQTSVEPLKHFVNVPYLFAIGQAFAFFALTTSFLGVSLGLLDFLFDGLKVKKTSLSKLGLCSLVFLPPLVIAFLRPQIFIAALTYAGGIGCALLLGLLPIVLVWVGRYRRKYLENFPAQLPGGRLLLALMALFVAIELAIEFYLTVF